MIEEIVFLTPPAPHYLDSGQATYPAGKQKHRRRQNIGVFNLLIVTKGMLPMVEEDGRWQVGAGQALILRPDKQHEQFEFCAEDTHFFWLHFQIINIEGTRYMPEFVYAESVDPWYRQIKPFKAYLPKFTSLMDPVSTFEKTRQILILARSDHFTSKWQQQFLFQQILQDLLSSNRREIDPSDHLAYRTAEYLRGHFRETITNEMVGAELNFHPVYISRCVKKVYGLTPLEYLQHYRIERAKLLLLNSDLPIYRVSEEVGFNHETYFTRCFTKQEGISPLSFRKRYRTPK